MASASPKPADSRDDHMEPAQPAPATIRRGCPPLETCPCPEPLKETAPGTALSPFVHAIPLRGGFKTPVGCKNRSRPSQRSKAVSFFEPPSSPSEPDRPERVPSPQFWMEPPEDVLGGEVALELLLARSEQAGVAIGCATAYPTGFQFTLQLRLREQAPERVWMGPPWDHGGPRRETSQPGDELPEELFRVGVQFADGSKATTLETGLLGTLVDSSGRTLVESHGGGLAGRKLESPVLLAQGGRGGLRGWSESLWLSPLPPEGRLSFVCEWPAFGIALTRAEVDAALIRDAAARSRAPWGDGQGRRG
jgi:hypothetical protein